MNTERSRLESVIHNLCYRLAARRGVRTITEAARALGVTREHLSRVIHGHRHSRSLTARYSQLQKSA